MVAGCIGLMSPLAAQADSLQQLVLHALEIDPSLAEAQANVLGAEARTRSAFREHYPKVGVEASQPVGDQRESFFDTNDVRVYGQLNLFAGGGIDASVRGSKKDAHRYEEIEAESREDVAYRVASLYLSGLEAAEELSLARTNLLRHDSLTHDLQIVAKLDVGRQSDLTQALSRQVQARARVITAETSMGVIQGRLLRYTAGQPVTFESLAIEAPELHESPVLLIARQPEYQAQVAEVERLQAQVDIAKSYYWPRVDVQSAVTADKSTRLLVNWDVIDASKFSDTTSARQAVAAARAHLATVEADLRERFETVRVSYELAGRKQKAVEEQIANAQQVVADFEGQFQIARRSMIDLLNAYAELAGVESAANQARSDYLSAALQYLRAQGKTEAWARESVGDRNRLAEGAASTP